MALAERQFSATVNASGVCLIDIRTRSRLQIWTVNQVSTRADDAPIGAACYLQFNGGPVTPMVSNGDVADGSPPITLRGSDLLRIRWESCTPGTSFSAQIFFDDGT